MWFFRKKRPKVINYSSYTVIGLFKVYASHVSDDDVLVNEWLIEGGSEQLLHHVQGQDHNRYNCNRSQSVINSQISS